MPKRVIEIPDELSELGDAFEAMLADVRGTVAVRVVVRPSNTRKWRRLYPQTPGGSSGPRTGRSSVPRHQRTCGDRRWRALQPRRPLPGVAGHVKPRNSDQRQGATAGDVERASWTRHTGK
jgi:hypothetical protein